MNISNVSPNRKSQTPDIVYIRTYLHLRNSLTKNIEHESDQAVQVIVVYKKDGARNIRNDSDDTIRKIQNVGDYIG